MDKRHCILALSLFLVLLVSACKPSGAAAGTAPRTPFIGGTAGITINFEKDSPPPEVTDDGTFAFNAIVRLKNDGEANVVKNDIKLNLIGFDPNDFSIHNFNDVRDQLPDDDLRARRRDAEGSIIEGTTTFATFPKGSNDFNPQTFAGNTEFTFRTDVCYNYQTQSNTKMCMLRDMINVRDNSLCKPNGAKTIYSSSAPVQVANFRQSVVGKDKISFSFDVVLSGNVDIFWDTFGQKPTSSFETGCPRDPKIRRARENSVGVELTEIPTDPIVQSFKCGGLDLEGGKKGIIKLVSGRRTVTCTVELVTDRLDLEKNVGINLIYNVLDNKETKVLVKHLVSS